MFRNRNSKFLSLGLPLLLTLTIGAASADTVMRGGSVMENPNFQTVVRLRCEPSNAPSHSTVNVQNTYKTPISAGQQILWYFTSYQGGFSGQTALKATLNPGQWITVSKLGPNAHIMKCSARIVF